ncbi:MAG: hypothetical protein V3T13_05070, partial [Hyphomicrobium sp.]
MRDAAAKSRFDVAESAEAVEKGHRRLRHIGGLSGRGSSGPNPSASLTAALNYFTASGQLPWLYAFVPAATEQLQAQDDADQT